jgi:hypothetical protein
VFGHFDQRLLPLYVVAIIYPIVTGSNGGYYVGAKHSLSAIKVVILLPAESTPGQENLALVKQIYSLKLLQFSLSIFYAACATRLFLLHISTIFTLTLYTSTGTQLFQWVLHEKGDHNGMTIKTVLLFYIC